MGSQNEIPFKLLTKKQEDNTPRGDTLTTKQEKFCRGITGDKKEKNRE